MQQCMQNTTGQHAQQAGSALGVVPLAAGHSLTPVTRRLVRPMVGEPSCETRNCRMAVCLPGCRGTTEAPVSCAQGTQRRVSWSSQYLSDSLLCRHQTWHAAQLAAHDSYTQMATGSSYRRWLQKQPSETSHVVSRRGGDHTAAANIKYGLDSDVMMGGTCLDGRSPAVVDGNTCGGQCPGSKLRER